MEVLSLAIAHAVFYASSSYNYTDSPTINWTEFDSNRWWGPTSEQATQDTAIYPTNITFSDDMIADLRSRLDNQRNWTAPLEGVAFQYGFNNDQINTWTTFWSKQYNFTERLIKYNQYPMYKTNIQGMDIFYIRVTPEALFLSSVKSDESAVSDAEADTKSHFEDVKNTFKETVPSGVEIVPMLLLHGWPCSVFDFFDAIPLLTAVSSDRDFAIELIIPSLPGYGFSEGPVRPGFGASQAAVVMRNLMKRIGFTKYYLQGGDIGGRIISHLATLYPDEVLGFHTNWGILLSPVAIMLQMVGSLYPPLVVKENLIYRMYPLTTWFTGLMGGTGYMHLQATKPDTIGVALSDSPAGLMAYVLEKFAAAKPSNTLLADGGLFDSYDPSFLMDTVMYYWSTNSMQTAMRIYADTFNKYHFSLRLEEYPTHVPTWIVQPLYEMTYQSPIILGLKYKNIIETEVLDDGGHFFAHEKPEIFAASVLKALTKFRAYHACVAALGSTSTNTTNLQCVIQISDTNLCSGSM